MLNAIDLIVSKLQKAYDELMAMRMQVIKEKKFETFKGKVGSFKNKIEPFAKSFGFSALKDEESKKRPVANTPHFQ